MWCTVALRLRNRNFCFGARGVWAIPHPQKAHRGGEDAFFSHPFGIGVADGVGGYAKENIDPAAYTRNVMRYCLKAVANADQEEGISALETLNYGAYMAMKEKTLGGCPAAVVTIRREGRASVLNLGDCGVRVLRGDKLLYQSQQQQHSFNCPFQLPTDLPSAGEQYMFDVEEKDIFLCASDGVLDNVELDDLISHMKNTGSRSCIAVAKEIAQQAFTNAKDTKYLSPFAKNALSAGYNFRGGKLDDITVLVAMITPIAEATETNTIQLITDIFPNVS